MRDRWNETIAFGLFVCGFICQPLIVLFFWSRTWDDSAITMAFGRTFSHTGVIEGTPGSGIVEGYSTTLWMLVLAALSRVVTSPAALLTAAKVLCCLLNMLNIVLVRKFVRRSGQSVVANLTAGSFGLMELTLYESINAMEGPMMLTLMLAAVLCLPLKRPRDYAIFLLATCLFIVARFEALALILPLLLFTGPWRNRILICVAWLGTLVISEWARWTYFGSWVPNTVLAKRHPPYSSSTLYEEILRHLAPVISLPRLLAAIFIVLLFATILGWKQLHERLAAIDMSELRRSVKDGLKNTHPLEVAAALAITGILIDFAIGKNWGPPDRELFPILPFVIFLLLSATFDLAQAANHRRLVCILFAIVLSYRTVRIAQRLQNPRAPLYMPGITVNTIASLVPPVEHIRKAASLASLTFATPDVGGVMLFSTNVRVLDLGMLCDRRLARKGYSQAPAYIFVERKPEVIESHQFWTLLSHFGDSEQLYSDYAPMYIGRRRFFVRNDVFEKVETATVRRSFLGNGHPQPEDDIRPGDNSPYPVYDDPDFRINSKFGTYFVFRQ